MECRAGTSSSPALGSSASRISTAPFPNKFRPSFGFLLLSASVHNASFHHGAHMADGIRAVILKPFRNDRHKAMDIKRHHIVPIGFRNLEALQNRDKNMAHHPAVRLVQLKRTGFFQCRSEEALILCDIFQIRRQIRRRNQIQFVQRAFPDSGNRTAITTTVTITIRNTAPPVMAFIIFR